jgi:hypothetical protein
MATPRRLARRRRRGIGAGHTAGVDDVLVDALTPVWRDVQRTAGVSLGINDRPWHDDEARYPSATVWALDGTQRGIYVDRDAAPRQRVLEVARELQEIVNQARAKDGMSPSWPPCPLHSAGHALAPTTTRGAPTWTCTETQRGVARIGELPDDRPPVRRRVTRP